MKIEPSLKGAARSANLSLVMLCCGFSVPAFGARVNATGALGQSDISGNPVYTVATANNLASTSGYASARGLAVDGSGHRLFIADTTNHRVLVVPLTAGNAISTPNAAFVLGQASSRTTASGTTASTLNAPNGLAYDGVHKLLFVADAGNNRVVAFNVNSATMTSGENASYVLGQPNFTTGTAGVTQAKLAGPSAVGYDGLHSSLLVADTGNNRILSFPVSGITNGENATFVIGQAGFTTGTAATTQTGLSRPSGVAYDAGDNLILVADALNNRVLAYPGAPSVSAQAATFVLGQGDFSTGSFGATDSRLRTTFVSNNGNLAYDEATHSLFLSDTFNKRVMVWAGLSAAFVSGTPATWQYGQQDFFSVANTLATNPAGTISQPVGLAYDPLSSSIFVADNLNKRVISFAYPPTSTLPDASGLLGHALYTVTSTNNSPNGTGFATPSGAALDTASHRLFVTDGSARRVMVFPLDNSNSLASQTAAYVIGQDNLYTPAAAGACAANRFGLAAGTVYDSANNRLFVADSSNNRVLIFNRMDPVHIASGPSADYVIGQPDFVTCTAATTQTGLRVPANLAYDAVNLRLFVSDSSNSRVMIYDVRPANLASLNPGAGTALSASYVLGQADFVTSTARLLASGLKSPTGLAYDPASGNLFVSDKPQHRVMVWNAGPANLASRIPGFGTALDAKYCLGQLDFLSNISRTTQWGFSAPDDLVFDPVANRLLVADLNNNRVMFFDASAFSLASVNPGYGGILSATTNLGQPDWITASASTTQYGFSGPNLGPSFDPAQNVLFVREASNNRVVQVQMIHITATLPNGTSGTAYLQRVTTVGGQGSISFSVSSGALPSGLSLDPVTGVISGTPAPTALSTFTVEVRDTFANTGYFFDRVTYSLSFPSVTAPFRIVTPTTASNDGSANSVSPLTAAYPASNTPGNFLWMSFLADSNIGAVATVTDSRGNIWNRATGVTGTTAGRLEIWYAMNARAGSNSVAVTYSGGGQAQVFLHEWINVAQSAALDVVAVGNGASSTYSSGTGTTTGFNDLIVGAVIANTSSALAAGPGFTRIGSSVGSLSRADEAGAFSPGSNAAIFSSTLSTTHVVAMAAFRPALQDYTVSGVTAGNVGTPSAAITWRKGTGTWTNCTLFVSDGGRGGIWAGAITGTSTGSFTANGVSSFSATYQPAVSSPVTFTYSNNCSLSDPPASLFSQPGFSFSGCPTTGLKGVASSPCVVTLAGATASSVTIVDGGNGGLIVPVAGASCTTPCNIPLSGGTAVFTYKAAVIGFLPLTTTNPAGLVNAPPVNDLVTTTSTAYAAVASGTWNSSSTWMPTGTPGSGDTWIIPAPYTVHVPAGYTAISGSCPVSNTFSDGIINNGAALIVDSGATFRMQGNIRLNGTAGTGRNFPILQYSNGSIITPDECNQAIAYGPFAADHRTYNVFSVGVDTSIVNTSGTTVTRTSGAGFNTTGSWNGLTMTISGMPYTISGCGTANSCTLTSSPGSQTGSIALVTQAGALTWPPATSITGINNSLTNPVLINGIGNTDYLSATIYGAAISYCGSASRGCFPTSLPNFGHYSGLLNRSDMQNFLMDHTGGEPAEFVTSAESSVYVRKNGKYSNSLSTISLDANMGPGTATGGSYCNVENIYSDVSAGTANHYHFNNCTLKGLFLASDIYLGTQVSETNKWTSLDNAVVLRPTCTDYLYWGGNASNFLVDCLTGGASMHITASFSTIPMVFDGGICQRESARTEAQFIRVFGNSTQPVALRNNLLLPSTVDGSLCGSLSVIASQTDTASPFPPLSILNNTLVGTPFIGSVVWTGHPGVAFASNVWLPSMQGNVVYQSTTPALDSLPLATWWNGASAPPDQIVAAGVDYNALWNQATSSQFSGGLNPGCAPSTSNGTHYDICTTAGVPGLHDLVADPQFVDPTRNLNTWATTQGQASTSAGAAAVFAAAPPSTYPTLLANLFGYIRGGFVPANPAYKGAGAGGTDLAGCCSPAVGNASLPTLTDPSLAVSQVVAGITQPTSMAFIGANDFLILEKASGKVKRVQNGVVTATVLDLPVNSFQERGLLGITLDRNFPTNPSVYLYWTESSTGNDTSDASQVGNPVSVFAPGTAQPLGNRVDRFTWNVTTQSLSFAANLITLRVWQNEKNNPIQSTTFTPQGTHNGGKLATGPDGKIYIMVGDTGRRGWMQNLPNGPFIPSTVDDQFGGPSPDTNHLTGVILRLNTDGSTPADNPFFAAGAAIGAQLGDNIQKVFTYGHRDSFGLAFDPLSGNLWESEKGDDSFDEINRIQAGGNYGWIQAMGPLSRIAQFKAIETNMLASPTDPIGTLEQLRYGTTRIAYSAAAAQSGLFALPGSTYRDPELSWRYSIIPSGLGFLTGNGLGSIYAGTLWSGEGSTKAITGGSTGAFTGGALLLLRLTPDRLHLDLSSDSRLADHVADNGVAYPPPFGTSAGAAGYKFDGRESETLLVGQGFGVITDIQSGPDGCLYVTSGSSGTVYKIRLAP